MMRMTAFDPAKLDAIRTVVTHDSCPDGTASAILLKDALRDSSRRDVTVKFVQYGTAAYDALPVEHGMMFCDISPPAARVKEFVDAGALILDHHKTAKPVVDAFGENGVFGDEKGEPGVCGAVLAFRHVWMPRKGHLASSAVSFAANFAKLAGIRDTWQRSDALWKQACVQANVLHFIPNDQWLSFTLGELAFAWQKNFEPIGALLFEKNERAVARAIQASYRFTSKKGTRVLMFDGLTLSSDAAEALGAEADLVVGFMPSNEDGVLKYIFSNRSHTTFDCASFAKSHGGGGHTKAAGFSLPISFETALNPYATYAALLDTYEASR